MFGQVDGKKQWCPYCERSVLAVRVYRNGLWQGIFLLLTFATCGLALPLLILSTRPIYQCPRCGS